MAAGEGREDWQPSAPGWLEAVCQASAVPQPAVSTSIDRLFAVLSGVHARVEGAVPTLDRAKGWQLLAAVARCCSLWWHRSRVRVASLKLAGKNLWVANCNQARGQQETVRDTVMFQGSEAGGLATEEQMCW